MMREFKQRQTRYNKVEEFKSKEDLELNKHLISDLQIDENGNQVRIVDGKKIIQIPENSIEDVKKNELINLWRMRNR